MAFTEELKTTEREKTLAHWLKTSCGLQSVSLQAIPGDASFRRYFRVHTTNGSFVAMDAPPQKENCRPFIAIAKALRSLNLNTPEIFHADIDQGLLLITDFGDATYLKTLNVHNAGQLYHCALDALCVLQSCKEVPGHQLPLFNRDFMRQEWDWHKEWFLNKLLHIAPGDQEKALDQCFAVLVESAANQPQVFMHRDYHSANLMAVASAQPGILDFQDAFLGPVTYDLASLLRDCYIDWPRENVEAWALYYWRKLQENGVLVRTGAQEFLRWFDLMGIERHLKALFTFARKQVRDQQPQYLKHVPRVLNYLLEVSSRYPELSALHDFYGFVVPVFQKETQTR